MKRLFGRVELSAAILCLLAVMALPLAAIVARLFDTSVPGAAPLVQHATLWLAFLGAGLAASEGKLLALASAKFMGDGRAGRVAGALATAVAVCVSALMCRACIDLVVIERDAGTVVIDGLPTWVAQLVLPISFGLIALRLIARCKGWSLRSFALLGLVAGVLAGQFPESLEGAPAWPGLVAIVIATVLGAPLFVALAGLALLYFMVDGVPVAAVPVEIYRMSVSPFLPAIPLFTLTGFLLAEGRVALRLLRVFRALFGWIPGGTAVVCALLCAFMTVFTGGSGVTILALGGLLYQALKADGYRDRFSLGLLTASGSLGLLLPPAFPLILYGIVAQVSIEELFIGGIVPGLLMIGLIAAWGVREGIKHKAGRTPFELREIAPAIWQAKFELLLPLIVLIAIFGGYATIVEAAALAAGYALLLQLVIHREVSLVRDLPRVLKECLVLLGGVLIILGAAMGFTSYLVDAQVPMLLLDWVQQYVHSPLAFLLCLNLFLLLVGCLMDIFAATVVVVPLIVPLGAAYGIDPIHLGIVFIASLELGYLTPPVGMNLFLASYRFERPLLEVYRAALPMLVILGFGVLLVTYFPPLTLGLLALLGR